jgi:hypothetical protein
MADKLSLYNLALGHLQERRLKSLAEEREPRRVLDDYWDQVAAYCLERKFWNFIYRTVAIDASSTVVPAFGYLYAFTIPIDWIRTRKISGVETLDPPLLQYVEEAGYWYANITPIYVQYNSRDPLYGLNLGAWPASFTDYVALRLASQSCKRITGKKDLLEGPDGLLTQEKKAYMVASANCAMNEAIGFRPQGSWTRARRGFTPMLPGPGGDTPAGGSLIP